MILLSAQTISAGGIGSLITKVSGKRIFQSLSRFHGHDKIGKLLLIEAKGDYLDGDDSKAKLELGRKWQEQAGRMYRYLWFLRTKVLEWTERTHLINS